METNKQNQPIIIEQTRLQITTDDYQQDWYGLSYPPWLQLIWNNY